MQSRVGRSGVRVVVVALAAAAAVAAPQAASGAVAWISSPSGNIGCEIADRYIGLTYAYCQSWRRPHTVRMRLDGRLRICRGTGCLGNGPENIVTLRYGASRVVGRFRCTSLRAGMRCVVRATGRGFIINRDTIRRVG